MSGSDWLNGIKVLAEMLNHPAIYVGALFIFIWVMVVTPFVERKFFHRNGQETEETSHE